jgi:site-specific DNA-methyltransferase (adenine-specific)
MDATKRSPSEQRLMPSPECDGNPSANLPPTEWRNAIVCGDALATIQAMPRDQIDVVITSPPYFQQRDYGPKEQIGHEARSEDYVERLVEVFAAARGVVKPTGSLWLVLGDKYLDRQLLGLPWRVALGLQAAGWVLRSDVIWHKPNAMPSPARNRPTTDHEYVFFFSKGKDYFYDADAIREPHVTFSANSKMRGGRKHFGVRGGTPEQGKNGGQQNLHDGRWDQAFHPLGRNKRTVWSIPLSKFRGAHFAVFPEPLVETCIAASCPPGGTVFDPFCGSGTVPVVARRMSRNYLGIDCNADYCQIAKQRLGSHPLLNFPE